MTGSPVYLAGLLLRGRDVLVVGAGRVATRRLPALLDSGARVRVVAPEATRELAALARDGLLLWEQAAFRDDHLGDAWYVLAATDDPAVNATVARLAEERHTFCVRADDADAGSAWTPATEQVDGLTVGVIGNRDPQRSKVIRDAIATALEQWISGSASTDR